MKNRIGRRSIAATAALLAALALGGCSQIGDLLSGGKQAARDGETGEIVEGGKLDVFQLKVGDCYNASSAEQISDVPTVACTAPHDLEVFAEFAMPDGAYPGKDAINAFAEEKCPGAFAAYIGRPYADSALDWDILFPTQEGWTDRKLKDRLVQCVVYDGKDTAPTRITGSLKGANR